MAASYEHTPRGARNGECGGATYHPAAGRSCLPFRCAMRKQPDTGLSLDLIAIDVTGARDQRSIADPAGLGVGVSQWLWLWPPSRGP